MKDLTVKMKEIIENGEALLTEGFPNFSTLKTYSLLGYKQQGQLKASPKNNINLACWALGRLGNKQIKNHEYFMEKYFFINPKKWGVYDLTLLNAELDKTDRPLSGKIKENVIDVLGKGATFGSLNLYGTQSMQTKATCKKILIGLTNGKELAESEVIFRLKDRLKILKLESFVSLVTIVARELATAPKRYDSSVATLNMVSLLNNSDLLLLEKIFDTVLFRVQSFSKKYHISAINTGKLFDTEKPWVKFFDGYTNVSAPNFLNLVCFFNQLDLLDSKSIQELDRMADEKKLNKRAIKQPYLRPMMKYHDLIVNRKQTIEDLFTIYGKGVLKRDFVASYNRWKEIEYLTVFWRK